MVGARSVARAVARPVRTPNHINEAFDGATKVCCSFYHTWSGDGDVSAEGGRVCTKCGGRRFNSYERCMDCRNARAKIREQRIAFNGGNHTKREWQTLLAASPHCAECGRSWTDVPPRPDPRYRNVWTKGHKLPVRHGGPNDIGNIQAECYQCNFRKNAGTSP
jgi:hypothetical protein